MMSANTVHSMHPNSIMAYRKMLQDDTIGNKQKQVFLSIYQGRRMTRQDVAKDLKWEINRVTGRVTELINKGLVHEPNVIKIEGSSRGVLEVTQTGVSYLERFF